MEDLLPKEGIQFTPISEGSNAIRKEQGNVEAFELLELSRMVQCEHCLKCMPTGHAHAN